MQPGKHFPWEKKGLAGQRCPLFTIWIGGISVSSGGEGAGEELPLVCICCSSSCSDSRAALILR